MKICAIVLPVFLAMTASCGGGVGDTVIDVTYDPCDSLVVAPAADVSDSEWASIADAIAMWNSVAQTRFTLEDVPGAPRLPVLFEEAAPNFYGIYLDEEGHVVINRRLTDPHGRAVTIAHEMGHAFGLTHLEPDAEVSVMNPANLEIEPTLEDAGRLAEVWGRCPAPTLAPELR